jgi:hypothetical protein
MWLGAGGVTVHRLLNPEESVRHLDWIRNLAWLDPESGEAFRHLAFFLPGGRIAVALVTSLSLAVVFLLLSRLFDRRVTVVTVGLLALDPFLIGHSGLLHTDALLSTFGFLTLVSALNGLRSPRWALWWPLTGMFAGLALLTKSPALIFVGFVPLLLGLRCVQSGVNGSLKAGDCLRAIAHGLLFVVFLAITFCSLHPGVWADPVSTFQRSFSLAGRHITSVQHPVFFAGETVLDPGVAFYPVVFFFRISPLVLLGLVLGLARLSALQPERRFAFLALLLVALLFGVGISLSTKKHDRYLLPLFPPLALAAALGGAGLLDRALDKVAGSFKPTVSQSSAVSTYGLGALLVVLLQGIFALASAAYPLTYYNPLLGGMSTAADMVPTGWGEGWGTAARRLNQLPEADRLNVAAASVPSFAPVFRGHTLPLEDDEIPLADYVVVDHLDDERKGLTVWDSLIVPSRRRPTTIYENKAPLEVANWLTVRVRPDDLILLDADTPLRHHYSGAAELLSARSIPDEATLADWLAEHVPGHDAVWLVSSPGASPVTAEQLGRQLEELASPLHTTAVASSIVTKLAPKPRPGMASPAAYRASFGGQLALVDGVVPESVRWPQSLEITLRWRTLFDLGTDHQAVVVLRSDDGHGWVREESPVRNGVNFPTSAWKAGEWADTTYNLRLLPDLPPDRYRVEISLYNKETGARLGAVDSEGAFQGTRVRIGEVEIAPPQKSPGAGTLNIVERLDMPAGPLRLIGTGDVPERVLSGDHLSFELFWQADKTPEADYRVRLALDNPHEEAELGVVAPLSPYPTSQWQAGDRFRNHHSLHVAPSLSSGQWQLLLNVLDEKGDPLWERDRPLGSVHVMPRQRDFTMPADVPHQMRVSFGEMIQLRGYAVPRTAVKPGEAIPLKLYLQSEGPTDRSYTLFVHLIGPDGEVEDQVDGIPGNGTAPTSSWAAGQVVAEEVVLTAASSAEVGSYRIAVGFYDAAYGKRLSVTDGDGGVLPENRVILPTQVMVAR